MIFDLVETKPNAAAALDVCIVGAGAAGITLAVALARGGKSVYLLEAGGASLEPSAQDSLQGVSESLAHRGLHEGRFRVHGGTTTRWGGQILELDDEDFTWRPWVNGSGWPLAKSEMRSFYKRAAELEGIGNAEFEDAEVWRRIVVAPPALDRLQTYLSRWCPEPDFSRLHAARLNSTRIHLWSHANVVELILEGQTAIGVRAFSMNGQSAVFRARQYVFCMGGIESSRFFLQPRQGPLPWNRSGLLGCHFQDHIDCNVGVFMPASLPWFHRGFDAIFLNGFKYQPKLKLAAVEQRKAGILNVAGAFAFEGRASEALAEARTTAKSLIRGRLSNLNAASVKNIARCLPAITRQAYRYAVRHRSFQPADSVIHLRAHCEQEPCSASSISLSSERDSLGLLRTRLSWRISPLELRTIRHFVGVAKKSLSPLGELRTMPNLDDDAGLTAACEDSFHHMGGMRMSPSASTGIVDTDLKLHGMRNAFVCSSAVFPSSGFSNPTHTLLALAVRLSDHLQS